MKTEKDIEEYLTKKLNYYKAQVLFLENKIYTINNNEELKNNEDITSYIIRLESDKHMYNLVLAELQDVYNFVNEEA